MKDVFSEKELVDLEYFIKDMGIKVGYDSQNFAVTNGCATYYLYLDGFEQRTCLFKPSYFGRNPKGNWIAVDFIIGKNGNCVLGTVRNIDPSVAKNSSNYSDFYKGYVGKYWKFDVPHDFFDYMNESKKSARKSLKEGLIDIRKQIQNYADANEFDITLQTTPKNELIIAFGGTSDTDKIYNALIKELKLKGANLSKVDVKKKNDIVVVTWDLNFSNEGMFDEIIIDGIIDLIDNLSEVVDLHYVF